MGWSAMRPRPTHLPAPLLGVSSHKHPSLGYARRMSVKFSDRWSYYSWSSQGHTDSESERQLILDMIRRSDSEDVVRYAESTSGGQVYVRTGLHSSHSESRDHVQVQLGCDSASFESSDWPGYTAHIIYNQSGTLRYETTLVRGLHSGHY